jgi:hypothetical protein
MGWENYGAQVGNSIASGAEAVVSYRLMGERRNLAELQEGRAQRELSLRERAYERDDEMHKSQSALLSLQAEKTTRSLRKREELAPYLVDFNNQMEVANAQYHKTYDPSVYEAVKIPDAVLSSNDPELIAGLQAQKRQAYTSATEDSLNVTEEGAMTSLARGINKLVKDDPANGLIASNKFKTVLAKRAERQKTVGVSFLDDEDLQVISGLNEMVSQNNSKKSQEALASKIIPAQYSAAEHAAYSENAATKLQVDSSNTAADAAINEQNTVMKILLQNKADLTKQMNSMSSESKRAAFRPQIEDLNKQIAESREILDKAVQVKQANLQGGAQAYATIAGKTQQNIQGLSGSYFANLPKVEAPKNVSAKKYSKKQEENLKAEIASGKYTKQDALVRMKKYGVVPSKDFADFLSQ